MRCSDEPRYQHTIVRVHDDSARDWASVEHNERNGWERTFTEPFPGGDVEVSLRRVVRP